MNNFWNNIVLNNPVKDWAIAFSIILASFILLRIFRSIVLKKAKAYAAKTETTLDDFAVSMISSSVMPLLYVLAFYFGLKYINMTDKVSNVLHVAILVVATFFILRVVTSFISYSVRRALAGPENNVHREKQADGVLVIIRVIIWLIGFLFLINNLGYNISTLVAGLGIGGIAIALAAQTILKDLFSYFVILFDRPFEIDDFIIVQDKMGTVEHIGIKTTRVRTLNGEQLVFSNTDLTDSRIHNYKRMQERRIVFALGVVYDTPLTKVKMIPQMIKTIIESLEDTRFDRAHFKEFGNFSLNFEVVYFILSADYNIYMDRQQAINLAIFEQFGKEQIEFAFPTQTLLVSQPGKEEMSPQLIKQEAKN